MNQPIKELIEISRFYGRDGRYVLAGGGNTSFKDDNTIWIKASGQTLAELTESGLVALSRGKLRDIALKSYSDDPAIREDQVKADLFRSMTDPSQKSRPSVETSLHESIRHSFVVHLHPSLLNGVLCSRNAKSLLSQDFGDEALFIPYTDPGYTLFKRLEHEILDYRARFRHDPGMIFLENHGVFVAADSTTGIKELYGKILSAVEKHVKPLSGIETLPDSPLLHRILPGMRMILSESKPKIIRHRQNTLLSRYSADQKEYQKISRPLVPDVIVYCKSRSLYVERSSTAESILDSFRSQLPRFLQDHGYPPKVIVIKDVGVLAADDSASAAETVLDVFEDNVRIGHYASQCGGINPLTPEQVRFIDQWEAEHYRRNVAKAAGRESRLSGKIAVITGGAQGFGAGIAEALFRLDVNVVIADINEEAGHSFVSRLTKDKGPAKAVFIRTDVSDPRSVKELVERTVCEFGGLDIMVSNAGILIAGSLEEMEPEAFARVTAIDYHGFYYCAKYASEVMKRQHAEKPDHFTDIIQINSKSGLRGSNRNFAYSGAKFGGIGLTQSFAMELAPYRIKVNAICPGNFYEGPLWSDPHNGLFVQYLKAGKVPGAKTIDEVRGFYEDQVPLKRGCRLDDVMKAVLYVIDQEYETGQAVPVTGGQVMQG